MVVVDIFTLELAMLKWGASGAVTLVCGATVQRLARGCWRQPIERRRAFRGFFYRAENDFYHVYSQE